MTFSVCVLASGSSGNCVYVGSDRTRILIDAGLGAEKVKARLQAIGVAPESIDAICVTHEHSDHTSSLRALQRLTGAKLYANAGTVEGLSSASGSSGLPWLLFSTGFPFMIGELQVEPFSVPHDANDPVGFTIKAGETKVGVVTDLGMATELIRKKLNDCSVIALEANHDEGMLQASTRPESKKRRIAGHRGHLSNLQAGELICDVATERLHTVLLAHLSQECNKPSLAEYTVKEALRRRKLSRINVVLTYDCCATEMVTA